MKQYLQLLGAIKENGTHKPDARENMPGTQSLFGYQFRHNLADGFPLLTTKKVFFKGVVVELLWFLRGDTNIQYLVDNGVNIWNEDAYNYYCKKCKEQGITLPMKFDSFISEVKSGNLSHTDLVDFQLGDCGFQYGKVWRKWDAGSMGYIDQIKNLIDGLRNGPESRRHIVTAWDPANDQNLALTWCHALFQYNSRPLTEQQRNDYFFKNVEVGTNSSHEALDALNCPKYYLDCQLYQRSADSVLGVPFNIASYALLTEILAKMCNMIPGELIMSYGDLHIYDNHYEAVEEQLGRIPTQLPKLKVTDWGNDWTKYGVELFDALKFSDFEVENYNPQPAIKATLSTGLIK